MDYSSTGTQLHKHQWDNIHDPVAVLGLFEGDEEGAAMSLPCLGIFDDCDDVLSSLRSLREAVTNNEEVIAKYPLDGKIRREAFSVNIAGIDYENITIIYKGEPNTRYYVKPQEYKDFVEAVSLTDGSVENQNGFVLKFGDKIIVKILIFEDQDKVSSKKEALRKYLFENLVAIGEKSVSEQKRIAVEVAINQMKEYLGNDYEQETGSLRTDLTTDAVTKMDCSEFVSRFLQKVTGNDEVPAFNTSTMVDDIENSNDYFEFVEGSDELEFKDIHPGDIFLWRDGGGHTGVVTWYNPTQDKVGVIEAIGSGGANEESLSKSIEGYCKGCIRNSVYSRTGKALAGHSGWKGYLRPKIKTK